MSKIHVNWGQLESVKGGIKRDAENFLREIGKSFSIIPRPAPQTSSSSQYFNRLSNIASLFGLSIPTDLFKAKNYAEFQLSGVRLIRKESLHIIRLHDLFPLTNPEWFRKRTRWMFEKAIRAAVQSNNSTFVCNSKFTLNQLETIFPNRTYNSYILPCTNELKSVRMCEKCQGCGELSQIQEDFILMVGTIEPRKSYLSLIAYIEQVNRKVVIIGRYGWRQKNVKKRIIRLTHEGQLLWLNECCDGALSEYYKKASLFLSTSLEEGYNIAAMEATSYGLTLVLRLNTGHLENYSENAFFFKDAKEMLTILNEDIS